MTKLYVSEYLAMPLVTTPNGQAAQCPDEPPIATQVVDYSGGAAASAAFNSKTKFVRIHADSVCSVKFGGASVTATTNDPRLAAGISEFRGVSSSDVTKVSAITNT